MSEPTIELRAWVRIVSGPLHRRGEERTGVVDAEREYPSGRCLRVINPDTKANWGWIHENDLRVTTKPTYVSQVSADVQQRAMDLLMAPRRAS